MKIRKILVACALVMTLVVASVSALAADALDVKIWDNNQLAGLQEIADLWTEQSGIPVNIQVVNWDNYWTLLEAGASGGDMPDVFWMHSNNAEMYMSAQKLLDLTDYIANSEVVDMDNYYADINALYSKDGKNYAVAKDHDTIALLYNKAIFDQYGVDYPTDDWTWEDYKAAAEAITEASGGTVYGGAVNTNNNQDSFYNIIYDFGGYVISDDKKSSGWDNENTIKAFEFMTTLMNTPDNPNSAWAPQTLLAESGKNVLFENGKIAMDTEGSWMIREFYDYEGSENFAWAMLPYWDANGNGQSDEGERVSIYNGLGWAASADVADPDAAWSLIEWFSSHEMQVKQSELGVTMAGYIGDSEPFMTSAFPGMDISAFLKMETEGTLVFRPYSKYTSRWEDDATRDLVTIWNDPSTMNDVLTKMAADMNNWLAQE
ncbi:MAG: sugar ABC transporter substrate-binding protein [Clostridia bacterium]|nr:sugar ABC transporter substrate-binding protein [Clostridia bacterium]